MNRINVPFLVVATAIVVVVGSLLIVNNGPGEGDVDSLKKGTTPAKAVATSEISRHATDIPPPITRKESATVVVNLDAVQLVAEIEDGVTYEYWTFNKTVPGPFIRVKEGDTVEVHLTHSHDHTAYNDTEEDMESFFNSFRISSYIPIALADGDHDHEEVDLSGIHAMPDGTIMTGSGEVLEDAVLLEDGSIQLGTGEIVGGSEMTDEEHTAAGHGEHSIDLHAAQGALGGAELIRTLPNETRAFQFKALKPGIYLYHCGSPHVATHLANGMYGVILVEPEGGLSPVDREFYITQGELYTSGETGEKGHHEFSLEKLLDEEPEYIPWNGRLGALDGDRALTANVGDTIRVFFASSGQLVSSFHVIGEILDRVYREGDLMTPPSENVQTTMVPAGGAMVTEFTVEVPGVYLFVDHALGRALNKGAHAQLIVEGEERPDIIRAVE